MPNRCSTFWACDFVGSPSSIRRCRQNDGPLLRRQASEARIFHSLDPACSLPETSEVGSGNVIVVKRL